MTEADVPVSTAGRRIGVGAVVVAVLAALAVTIGVSVLRGVAAPAELVPAPTGVAVEVTPGDELYVHVSGAVRAPGLYVLDTGARVVDAVAAAEGFSDDADLAAVNLARAVSDGEQLAVPRVGEGPAEAPGVGSDGRVDLNTATGADLETLPRIGPALAERIIAWRDENGRFTSVEDLLAVPGIGDKMLEALRDLVRI